MQPSFAHILQEENFFEKVECDLLAAVLLLLLLSSYVTNPIFFICISVGVNILLVCVSFFTAIVG